MPDPPKREVAIVGLSCLLPSANGPDELALRLRQGFDAVRPLPDVRAKLDDIVPDSMPPMGYIERVDLFDYRFFGLSSTEAQNMAPHHRLALELVHLAVCDAGYGRQNVAAARTGVVFASPESQYYRRLRKAGSTIRMGNRDAVLAGRIAYFYGFSGNTYILDTACSSGLVALHNACQMIASGELDQAVVGAVNLKVLNHGELLPYDQDPLALISPSFRCKTFDETADGIGLGEGGVVFLLKELNLARESGDVLWCTIPGCAVNQDGSRSNGLAAPSPEAQTEVVSTAWDRAGIEVDDLLLVETHGTGTKLGDPVELEALHEAFRRRTNRRSFCSIGSAKSNFGHLGGASGLLGVLKALICLNQRELFPTIHVKNPTPLYDWTDSPFFLQRGASDLPCESDVRIAGVSSFGLSGTNAHVVLSTTGSSRSYRGTDGSFFRRESCWVPSAPAELLSRASCSSAKRREAAIEACTKSDGELVATVCRIFADVLGEERMDPSSNFFELGGNSMLGVGLLTKLEDASGIELDFSVLYDSPTPAKLARLFAGREPSSVQENVDISTTATRLASHGQRRIWASQCLADSPLQGVDLSRVDFRGDLSPGKLRRILSDLFRSHSALHSRFSLTDKGLCIQPRNTVDALPYRFVDAMSCLDPETIVEREIAGLRAHPPGLVEGTPIQLVLVRTGPSRHCLLLCVNHAIMDGISKLILVRKILLGLSSEIRENMSTESNSYTSYLDWEERFAESPEWGKQLRFWTSLLSEDIGLVKLPYDHPPGNVRSSNGRRAEFPIPQSVRQKVERTCEKLKCSPFAYTLSVLSVVLFRYSGQARLVVGVPVSLRHSKAFRSSIGFFLNSLPVVFDIERKTPISEYLQASVARITECMENKEIPFDAIVEAVPGKTGVLGEPLFNVLFDFHNQWESFGKEDACAVHADYTSIFSGHVQHDIEITLKARASGWSLLLDYRASAFDNATVARMADSYVTALRSCASQDAQTVGSVGVLSDREFFRLTREVNETNNPLPTGDLLSHLARVCAENPDSIAVVHDGTEVSYAELSRQVEAVSAFLSSCGLRNGSLVALMLDRGPPYLRAVLSVLSCGATFLPLLPEDPTIRNVKIMHESRCEFLLANDGEMLKSDGSTIVGEVDDGIYLVRRTVPAPDNQVDSSPPDLSNVAYIIFTSGSTGIPKGAMVEHTGMLNHLYAKIRDLGLCASDRVLQNAPQCFDISIWQMLAPLLCGGRTVIISDKVARDPLLLMETILSEGITVIEAVPSMLQALLDVVDSPLCQPIVKSALRFLVSTGEQLPAKLCRELLRAFSMVPIVNAYGPTECSDDVTHAFIRTDEDVSGNSVPIGRPIQNMHVFVLDPGQQLLPAGAIGELYVGGVGVGAGYINNRKATADSFLPGNVLTESEGRLYRTGDLVRWQSDDQLEYVGRLDSQAKFLGNRVELQEIEHALLGMPGLSAAKVMVLEQEGRQQLIAFYIPKLDISLPETTVRAHLCERLPAFMQPSKIVSMASFPINRNGKVDMGALREHALESTRSDERPDPQRAATVFGKSAPHSEILQIVREVLGRDEIGLDDSLPEFGASSIDLIRIAARARALGHHIPIDGLSESPLSAALSPSRREYETTTPGCIIAPGSGILLSSPQRWFFASHPNYRGFQYRAFIAGIPSDLPDSLVVESATRLVARHDALRMGFTCTAGTWETFSCAPPFTLEVRRVAWKAGVGSVRHALKEILCRSSLDAPPLMKIVRVTGNKGVGDGHDMVVVAVHRLVCDTLSLNVLKAEFVGGCFHRATGTNACLPAPTPYSEWIRWEWQQKGGGLAGDRAVENWRHNPTMRMSPCIPDELSSRNTVGNMAELRVALQSPFLEIDKCKGKFAGLGVEEAVVAVILESMRNTLLGSQVLIDVGTHGRQPQGCPIDLSVTVGAFAGVYPLAIDYRRHPRFDDILRHVRDRLSEFRESSVTYLWLRYCSPDRFDRMRDVQPSWVSLDFLGLSPNEEKEGGELLDGIAPLVHDDALRPYLCEFLVSSTQDSLAVRLRYPGATFPESFASEYAKRLRESFSILEASLSGET